ncbi:MAG: B12-binding domain-containing radical SAM protein [Terracidiphilus sp.]
MRALLVQSPAISPWVPRKQWEPPSVAMATIAGQIDNHDVRVADAIIWRKQTVPRFLKLLREFRPDVVGFTSMTFQYETSVGLAYLTKQFDSRIRTVLGGYHATLFAENIAAGADAGWWDYLMRGEGDFAFGELLDSIEADGKGMENILGLSYKEEKTFRHNPARPLEDLARIRIPARDKRLVKGFHMYFRRADVIETSRGCLHQCNFCSIHEMYGRSFRLFPLDRVLADIEDAYGRGARHIFCTDDNITLDMDRFEQLCDEVIRLKLKNLMFTTQASPIGFAHRPDLAKKMVRAGFVSIFLGIENASTKNLRAMNKPNTLDTIQRGVAALQKENIMVIAGIINGLPDDDPESIRENYQFIKNLGINNVMDQIMTPYPKTPLRGEMIEDKRVVNLSDFRWYDGYFSNVRTRHLTPEELTFVRWKIRREVIGMWRATKADWKHFKGYTYLWEFGFRHIVWLNERLLELLFGIEGRYKLQMRHFLQLNDFGIEIPCRQRIETYHPIYGSNEDPYRDTRWSMLKRRLPFPWRKRLIAQEPS